MDQRVFETFLKRAIAKFESSFKHEVKLTNTQYLRFRELVRQVLKEADHHEITREKIHSLDKFPSIESEVVFRW